MEQKIEYRTVFYEKEQLLYKLIRKNVKNINLRIKRDGEVQVSAGCRVPVSYLDDFVVSRWSFIERARSQYQKESQKNTEILLPKQYVDGEEFLILGRKYKLVVVGTEEPVEKLLHSNAKAEEGWTDSSFEEQVLLRKEGICLFQNKTENLPEENWMLLRVKDKQDFSGKERTVKKWMKQQQIVLFEKISRNIYPEFEKLGVAYPVIKIRDMVSRWGSCQTGRGIITLNGKLLMAPVECIEYVVLHEFSHFIHPDHSIRFNHFVEERMPDWRERKERLNKEVPIR